MPPITYIMDLPCTCEHLNHSHICCHQAMWIYTCIYEHLNCMVIFVVIRKRALAMSNSPALVLSKSYFQKFIDNFHPPFSSPA